MLALIIAAAALASPVSSDEAAVRDLEHRSIFFRSATVAGSHGIPNIRR